MTQVLKDIDYKKVFSFFEEISNVPRGSRHNEKISEYLVNFAKERGLYYEQDEALNVIIVKDATAGCEDLDAVILQGHMDMVCLKDPDSNHDFSKDPLELIVEGDWIRANKTTLGGDNGIAIAYALAILDSSEIVHPRLEVIITTDEEIGLLGATALNTSSLKGRYLINLDSEEESSILVGCAGGLTAVAELPVAYEEVQGVRLDVTVAGLQGGHSGIDIVKNRTSATSLAARMILELQKEFTFSAMAMGSGEKDNAIPSIAELSFVGSESEVTKMVAKIKELQEVYKAELITSEPNVTITATKKDYDKFSCLTKDSLERILLFIMYQPNGIQTMSADIAGLVESSLNLGIFKVNTERALFSYSVRSSHSSYKAFMSDKLAHMTKFLGGTYHTEGEYPAWAYKHESKLRDIFVELYKEEFKRDPIIEVIHAGLECGVLYDKMPQLDIVSLGPDMHDVHTTKERLSISSTIRVFDYLVKVLAKLSEK